MKKRAQSAGVQSPVTSVASRGRVSSHRAHCSFAMNTFPLTRCCFQRVTGECSRMFLPEAASDRHEEELQEIGLHRPNSNSSGGNSCLR